MLISRQDIFGGRVVRLAVETVRLPNGHIAELEIIHHPGGAAVVALDDAGRVCLLRQYRHAAGGYVWELPAGKLEPGEPPAVTASRELAEEAGCTADRWQELGYSISSPGVLTERVYLYLARGLKPAARAVEDAEVFDVHWMPMAEALRLCQSGEISDSKTALGLWRARETLVADGAAIM